MTSPHPLAAWVERLQQPARRTRRPARARVARGPAGISPPENNAGEVEGQRTRWTLLSSHTGSGDS
jgi:hypothetical protein